MNRFFGSLTPCLLVAFASPLLFVLAPDGMPFVYAVCVTTPVTGTVNGLTVDVCRGCSATFPSVDSISVSSCYASKTFNKCEITGSLVLTITEDNSPADGCNVTWFSDCVVPNVSVDACGQETITGPRTNFSTYKSVACDSADDRLLVTLERNGLGVICNCNTGGGAIVFSALGECDGI